MNQCVLQHYKPTLSRSPLWFFLATLMLLLRGHASADQSALADPSDPSAGSVEISNLSPEYLLSVAVFEDAQECLGMKYLAELEKFKLKTTRLKHRETLSLWVTYSVGSPRGLTTCVGIYSLPFAQGDLRVVAERNAPLKKCLVNVSFSQDGEHWAPVPGLRRRISRTAILPEDPRCERE